ncbi:hypothetical protein J2S43_000447 [Catenuloplanes nepalensis]|uniref:LamG-like jellyroll fold domain-containing protein n=1 Tax=Catenuloplanes nepalensis TaxID=587533 RepID=A0ABT9MKJ2_9ACTN|nr:hypothetical protein [Catenuloplanes nepalensis]
MTSPSWSHTARKRLQAHRRAAALIALSVLAGTLPALWTTTAAAAPAQATQTDEGKALADAADSGQRVEVVSERTEYSQVFADPSGKLVLESSVLPQRVRGGNGSWSDRNLNLRPASDGTLRPTASVADVRFSPGGDGPAVTTVRDGQDMHLTWPTPLPPPTIDGDAAKYVEVLPGVDLVLRATATGFTHVLVVKTPEAADAPQVRQVQFEVGGDARLVEDPDGGLRAITDTVEIASADAPIMWDSTTTPTTAARVPQVGGGAPRPSTPAGPGDTASIKDVDAQITDDGHLRLIPDTGLLDAPPAAFPLYIDPAWSAGKWTWAYATNNNSTNNVHNAWVGLNPSTGVIHRSFFVFGTGPLKGKHIESAYVQMKLEHSWACTNQPTSMWYAGALTGTPRTAWATGLKGWMATLSSHANEAGGCGTIQPDPWNNFQGTAVTSRIQATANEGAKDITIAFTAQAQNGTLEGVQDRWKRFSMNDAKLIVDYDTPPTAPTSLRPAGNGSACGTVGTLTGKFQAIPHDTDGHAQTVEWQWAEVSTTGTYTTLPAPAKTSASNGGLAQSATVTLTDGKKYAFRARSTDPAPYTITGPWSAWCEFTPDITRPAQPTITMTTPPTGPGTVAEYTITTTDTDVTKFRYGWNQTPTTEIAATTNGALKTATVKLTTPKYGLINLHAYAVDVTLNDGVLGKSEDFIVPRPRSAAAKWGLETYADIDDTAALADQQHEIAGDTPLTTTSTSWTDNARLLNGRTLTFNNTAAQAVATGLTPDTTQSYSVAAWVKLNDLNGFQSIISTDADGNQWSPFRLQLRTDGGTRWCMTVNVRIDHGAALNLCSTTPPVANQWTHLAGSWDRTEGKVRLWVNGTETSQILVGTPVTTSKPVVIGRAASAGNRADQMRGSVADAQFFDRVLVTDDFTGQLATEEDSAGIDEPGIIEPIKIAAWRFETAYWCYEEGDYQSADLSCQAPDLSPFNRRLSLTTGTSVTAGRDGGSALELNATHFTDDPSDPHYGTTTAERAYAQRNTGTAGQHETWINSPVARTDQSFTVSAWLRPDALTGANHTALALTGSLQSAVTLGIRRYTVNGATQYRWAVNTHNSDTAAAVSSGISAIDKPVDMEGVGAVWTHVTAVFDAPTKTVRLHLNGDLAASGAWPSQWPTAGPLTLGASRYADTTNPTGRWTDHWNGAIDDVSIFQGAATSSAVHALFAVGS